MEKPTLDLIIYEFVQIFKVKIIKAICKYLVRGFFINPINIYWVLSVFQAYDYGKNRWLHWSPLFIYYIKGNLFLFMVLGNKPRACICEARALPLSYTPIPPLKNANKTWNLEEQIGSWTQITKLCIKCISTLKSNWTKMWIFSVTVGRDFWLVESKRKIMK